MQRELELNPQTVDVAEDFRKSGKTLEAVELTESILKPNHKLITSEQIQTLSHDPIQLSILSCLSRIYVDSSKTLANKTFLPWHTINHLQHAVEIIESVYRNPSVQEKLVGVAADHLGRPHDFAHEMPRDVQKTLAAASVLFNSDQALELVIQGESLLKDTYDSLDETNPTRPLIGIELLLSQSSRGLEIDRNQLINEYTNLLRLDPGNSERLATVSAWLLAWGEKHQDGDLERISSEVLGRMINRDEKLAHIPGKESLKSKLTSFRSFVFRLFTPITTSSADRDQLFSDLKQVSKDK